MDKKKIYRDYNEVGQAIKEGSFDVGRTTVWHRGKLYFLCKKE
jgi:hypothetical protein